MTKKNQNYEDEYKKREHGRNRYNNMSEVD